MHIFTNLLASQEKKWNDPPCQFSDGYLLCLNHAGRTRINITPIPQQTRATTRLAECLFVFLNNVKAPAVLFTSWFLPPYWKKKKRLRFGITVEADNISKSRVSVNNVQHKRSLKLVLIIVSSFYHGMPFLTRYALVTRFPLPCRKGGALDFMSLGNCSVLRYSNCQIVMRTAWMYQVSEVRERRPLQSLRYSKQVNSTLPHCAQVAALPNSFFRCQF